jgi:hypothetical protein
MNNSQEKAIERAKGSNTLLANLIFKTMYDKLQSVSTYIASLNHTLFLQTSYIIISAKAFCQEEQEVVSSEDAN